MVLQTSMFVLVQMSPIPLSRVSGINNPTNRGLPIPTHFRPESSGVETAQYGQPDLGHVD